MSLIGLQIIVLLFIQLLTGLLALFDSEIRDFLAKLGLLFLALFGFIDIVLILAGIPL